MSRADSQYLANLAKNIRKYRKENGFSQDRLSKEAEVAYNTIVKIESGENPNPTVETLKRIAKALDISIEKLFKGNVQKTATGEKSGIVSNFDRSKAEKKYNPTIFTTAMFVSEAVEARKK